VLLASPTSNPSQIHNPILRAIFNDENEKLIGDGSVGGRRNGIIIDFSKYQLSAQLF
jgi:hypothetical protein